MNTNSISGQKLNPFNNLEAGNLKDLLGGIPTDPTNNKSDNNLPKLEAAPKDITLSMHQNYGGVGNSVWALA